MKIVLGVVNREDQYAVTDALVHADHTATIISTTGGFLREGNATLLIGVEDEQVDEVLRIIEENCSTRTRYVYPFPAGAEWEEALIFTPVEVQVGGATVFVLNVERFARF